MNSTAKTFIFHYTLALSGGRELDLRGRYLAVLLFIRGLETFYLTPGETGSFVMDDDDDSESTRVTEMEIATMLEEVEGIHTTSDEPELNEDKEDDEKQTVILNQSMTKTGKAFNSTTIFGHT